MKTALIVACALIAGCAPQPQLQASAPAEDSLLPGTIGLIAKHTPAGVVVAEVKEDGTAAAVGVRPGDRVLRYNGAPVLTLREFNRRVLDSSPGTRARLHLEREGRTRSVELPVRELGTMPRV